MNDALWIIVIVIMAVALPASLAIYLLLNRNMEGDSEGNLFYDSNALTKWFGVPGSIGLLIVLLEWLDVIDLPDALIFLALFFVGAAVFVQAYAVPTARWRNYLREEKEKNEKKH